MVWLSVATGALVGLLLVLVLAHRRRRRPPYDVEGWRHDMGAIRAVADSDADAGTPAGGDAGRDAGAVRPPAPNIRIVPPAEPPEDREHR